LAYFWGGVQGVRGQLGTSVSTRGRRASRKQEEIGRVGQRRKRFGSQEANAARWCRQAEDRDRIARSERHTRRVRSNMSSAVTSRTAVDATDERLHGGEMLPIGAVNTLKKPNRN